jgi:hypothetical protein
MKPQHVHPKPYESCEDVIGRAYHQAAELTEKTGVVHQVHMRGSIKLGDLRCIIQPEGEA